MKNAAYLSLLMLWVWATACSNDDNPTPGNPPPPPGNPNPTWLIPTNQVRDGGVGKDGIPSIDNPTFTTDPNASDLSFLQPNDLVVGIRIGDEVRAYPHPILDWHEIVNDNLNGTPVALTYCPLTGTAIAWDRRVNGNETEFGVSGLLYNNNLMPYDRRTNSVWSQMRLDAVNGELIGTKATTWPIIETTWATWKTLYPDARVLRRPGAFSRPYGQYPYINEFGQDYREAEWLLFPISFEDDRLPRKERVLGILVGEEAKVYTFDHFPGSELTLIADEFMGERYVVVGSQELNLLTAFGTTLPDGTVLELSPVQGQLPVLLEDQEGNQWDVFGVAVSGPRLGERLPKPESYIGYFFAWGTFFPIVDIYEG
ncbi:MAG: DUF3179 domain-containing protein [Bacteroidetes bacterium]|nr:MAG: DUF3179 domain-containing protein [Bacteroidota bacterium]